MARPPKEHPERYEWIKERAEMLAALTGLNWLPDEIEYLWNNPEEYAKGEAYDPDEDYNQKAYALVHLCIGFGVEYERMYPTGGDFPESRVEDIEDASDAE